MYEINKQDLKDLQFVDSFIKNNEEKYLKIASNIFEELDEATTALYKNECTVQETLKVFEKYERIIDMIRNIFDSGLVHYCAFGSEIEEMASKFLSNKNRTDDENKYLNILHNIRWLSSTC